MRNFFVASCLSLSFVTGFSFAPIGLSRHSRSTRSLERLAHRAHSQFHNREPTKLFSSDPENIETEPSISKDGPPAESTETSVSTVTTPKTPPAPEGTEYPLDVPSPLLLATSMVLAIAGIGSVFELTGGNPNLGFGTTAAIAVVSIPVCLFLFYASILKATAETEADDKEFLKNGGR